MWFNSTPVANEVFDYWLREASPSEYKVLNVVVRQTMGWQDKSTLSERKERAWISNQLFKEKTNLSKGVIAGAIQVLFDKNAIRVFDEEGNLLDTPEKRRGKQRLYFQLGPGLIPISSKAVQDLSEKQTDLVRNMKYNKY